MRIKKNNKVTDSLIISSQPEERFLSIEYIRKDRTEGFAALERVSYFLSSVTSPESARSKYIYVYHLNLIHLSMCKTFIGACRFLIHQFRTLTFSFYLFFRIFNYPFLSFIQLFFKYELKI